MAPSPQNSKKILFISPYFAPAWSYGGPVTASFEFARELVRIGHKVTVFTTDALDEKKRIAKTNETIDGIEIVRFRNLSNILAKRVNFYLPIGFYKHLKRHIHEFDIIHIHEFFTLQAITTAKLCHRLNKNFIIQPHGSLQPWARRAKYSHIKNVFIKQFNRVSYSCRAIIVLTEIEKKDVEISLPRLKNRVTVLPNGINLSELTKIKPEKIKDKYKLRKSTNIITFFGRIIYKKGIDLTLRALAHLSPEIDFRFLIIGPDDGEKSNLLRLAEELNLANKLIFVGLLTGKKRFEYLKSSDISVLLSRSEGLPTSLLESAALGVPIVCSNTSNFEAVKKFKAGFVVSSPKEAAEKITAILTDEDLSKNIRKNCLTLSKTFDIKQKSLELLSIYSSD